MLGPSGRRVKRDTPVSFGRASQRHSSPRRYLGQSASNCRCLVRLISVPVDILKRILGLAQALRFFAAISDASPYQTPTQDPGRVGCRVLTVVAVQRSTTGQMKN